MISPRGGLECNPAEVARLLKQASAVTTVDTHASNDHVVTNNLASVTMFSPKHCKHDRRVVQGSFECLIVISFPPSEGNTNSNPPSSLNLDFKG